MSKKRRGLASAITLATLLSTSAIAADSKTEYYGHTHCGIPPSPHTDPTNIAPPEIHLTIKLKKDGKEVRLIANWEGIWYAKKVEGVFPESYERTEPVILLPEGVRERNRYHCGDMRAVDLNGNGNTELIYAFPEHLLVFENRGRGEALELASIDDIDYPATARVRILEVTWDAKAKDGRKWVLVTDGKKEKKIEVADGLMGEDCAKYFP